ncbi:MAG: VWA domain-containing protein [Halodesulfurarchaeum sp.]
MTEENDERRGVSVETVTQTRARLARELSRLVRGLREQGVAVPADGVLSGGRALAAVGLARKDRARTALRAALVSSPEDAESFDAVFERFWERLQAILEGQMVSTDTGSAADRPADVFAPIGGDAGGHMAAPSPGTTTETQADEQASVSETQERRVSREERTTGRVEAEYAPSGASSIGRREPVHVNRHRLGVESRVGTVIDEIGEQLAGRRSRRWAAGTTRPDIRRALREGISSGGVPMSLPEESRTRDEVRATVLVDVSRSVLDTIDRALLVTVLRAIGAKWQGVRLFLFDTDVREVTETVDERNATAALEALRAAEAEWGGGTQIGQALATVRQEFPDAIDRRTAIILISDGLETGDVARLAEEMARLARRSQTVLWLNPLAADPAFEPSARGLAAAMPYIDGLFAFASPADLEEIARQLRRRGFGGSIGYRYDSRRSED